MVWKELVLEAYNEAKEWVSGIGVSDIPPLEIVEDNEISDFCLKGKKLYANVNKIEHYFTTLYPTNRKGNTSSNVVYELAARIIHEIVEYDVLQRGTVNLAPFIAEYVENAYRYEKGIPKYTSPSLPEDLREKIAEIVMYLYRIRH